MKHLTKTLQCGFAILLTASGVLFSGAAMTANAQDKTKAVPSRPERSGRDPFSKYVPPRIIVKKNGGLIVPPSI
ncbi:MAG: hypothetical protein M3Y84_14720, partial [Acidobacteriota bacterium]|nr:hypothetical protein [Acidobacteriota bacterium]